MEARATAPSSPPPSEAARRPERDGGRPPTLSLAARASGSRSVPRRSPARTLGPGSLRPAGAPGSAKGVAPARVGGAGRVPEVTGPAREAGAATAVAGLRSCGVHPTLTLSRGSNRKSRLRCVGLFKAVSTHFGLRVQRCLVHALPRLLQICLSVCLSPFLNGQHPLSAPWGFFLSVNLQASGLRGASHPPHSGCISLPLSSKDLCPPNFSFCTLDIRASSAHPLRCGKPRNLEGRKACPSRGL